MAPCWWKWWWGCWVDDGHHDDVEDYNDEDDDEDDDGHHDKGEDFIKHSRGHRRQTGLFSHLVEVRIKIVIMINTLKELFLFSDGLRIIFNLFSPILSPLGPWTCCRRSAVNISEFPLVVNYFSFCAFLFFQRKPGRIRGPCQTWSQTLSPKIG